MTFLTLSPPGQLVLLPVSNLLLGRRSSYSYRLRCCRSRLDTGSNTSWPGGEKGQLLTGGMCTKVKLYVDCDGSCTGQGLGFFFGLGLKVCLQASAGRGFSPLTCTVSCCIIKALKILWCFVHNHACKGLLATKLVSSGKSRMVSKLACWLVLGGVSVPNLYCIVHVSEIGVVPSEHRSISLERGHILHLCLEAAQAQSTDVCCT